MEDCRLPFHPSPLSKGHHLIVCSFFDFVNSNEVGSDRVDLDFSFEDGKPQRECELYGSVDMVPPKRSDSKDSEVLSKPFVVYPGRRLTDSQVGVQKSALVIQFSHRRSEKASMSSKTNDKNPEIVDVGS